MIEQEPDTDDFTTGRRRQVLPPDPDQYIRTISRKRWALERLGFPDFRAGQELVFNVMAAQRDLLFVAPTALGKTASWTLPILAADWRALVFSPLKGLIRDQVQQYNQKFGIPAAGISSDMTDQENHTSLRRWVDGEVRFLYAAPERLNNESFRQALRQRFPDVVLVDEAHVISQWSHNFRPSYRQIGRFVEETNPRLVMACTATCTPEIEVDIRQVLGMQDAVVHFVYTPRDNLKLSSSSWVSEAELAHQLSRIPGKRLVYSGTIAVAEELAANLSKLMRQNVGVYHGEMATAIKQEFQDEFARGSLDCIVATNAFGMGIDIPDIRAVVHRHYPGSLEAYAQESGRGGRDGLNTFCLAYQDPKSESLQRFFIDSGHPDRSVVTKTYECLVSARSMDGLIQMTQKEVADRLRCGSRYIASAIQNLKAYGVVKKAAQRDRGCWVRRDPDGPHEQSLMIDQKFQTLWSTIQQSGTLTPDDRWCVDLDSLAQRMGQATTTIRKKLNDYGRMGAWHFEPPFRGEALRIVGDLSRVDFDWLRWARESAFQKLEKVSEFLDTPDSQKQAFLKNYFDYEARSS